VGSNALSRMAAMAYELALAMSTERRVAVTTVGQERIAGRVEQRLIDRSIPTAAGDPNASQLVYVIGGRRIHISQVAAIEDADG
jgi:hypothetical protein